MSSITARLFDGAGTFRTHLPRLTEVEVNDVLNEEGAGTLRYPVSAPGASLLTSLTDAQVAVYLDGREVFRFLIEDDEDDQADQAGPSRELVVGGPGALAVLSRGIVIPSKGIGKKPANWKFDNATPGAIMRTPHRRDEGTRLPGQRGRRIRAA